MPQRAAGLIWVKRPPDREGQIVASKDHVDAR